MMRRTIALGALALAPPSAAHAQNMAAHAQDGGAATTRPAAQDVVLTAREQRLTVPVSVAGAGPYPFLIDTGAQRTVISRELAGTLGLLPGRSVRVTAMSGVGPAGTVVIPSITVTPGGIAGRGIEAPALAAANLGAPGLLGLDTLQDRRVAIDLERRVMSVEPSAKRRRREVESPGEIVVRAKSLLGQLVVTDAYVGDVRVRVVLDTGSDASIGNFALRRRLGAARGAPGRVTLTSVLGGQLTADYTQLPHVTIGNLSIRALPVAYADAAPFERLGLTGKPAIMLGMDAIALFRRVEIDFPNRELRLLLPRSVAAERARPRPEPLG